MATNLGRRVVLLAIIAGGLILVVAGDLPHPVARAGHGGAYEAGVWLEGGALWVLEAVLIGLMVVLPCRWLYRHWDGRRPDLTQGFDRPAKVIPADASVPEPGSGERPREADELTWLRSRLERTRRRRAERTSRR